MKRLFLLGLALGVMALRAAVPPPSELFPQDTLAILTVPDYSSAQTQFQSEAFGRLWADASMKPFRDKFQTGFKHEVLGDLEKQLGIKTDDYLALLQGQVSFALLENGWNAADSKTEPSLVVVLDTKDKGSELKARLAEVRQKLADAKKPVKTDKIRDIDFSTVTVEHKAAKTDAKNGDADKDKDDDDKKTDDAKDSDRTEHWTFGQVDSVLLISDSPSALEKVVARLSGGSVPPLGELPDFQASAQSSHFKESMGYAWFNASAFVKQLRKLASKSGAGAAPLGVEPSKMITAAGLDGLKTMGISIWMTPDGEQSQLTMALPEGQRVGLFKMLEYAAKDSTPPAFVPADAVGFRRWRLNGKRTWENLEAMIQQISPQASGMLQLYLGTLGKDKDPNFDFQKSFVANLGDDLITYQKSPQDKTLEALQDAPSLTLIGSPDAAQLANGLRAAGSLLPSAGEGNKEREFNGHKIYGVKMPGKEGGDDGKLLEFAAGNGYLAISTNPSILEQFLRSGDGGGNSLKDNASMIAASEKVGGMATGLFGYQDAKEGTRIWWEVLRQSGSLDKLMGSSGDSSGGKKTAEWIDFSLLPPFDSVSKYLGLSVFSGKWDGAGFNMQAYWPIPK